MRPVVIAANWKMHTTPADAGALAAAIAAATGLPEVVRVICPPYVALAAVRDALAGSGVEVGAQNVHHELAGAYTGEVSAPMLAGLASWVIAGHSERRRDQGETDALINRKVAAARAQGLRVILCVGEQLADRDAGRAAAVVQAQVRACLLDLQEARRGDASGRSWLHLAYEPVWAIGTGRNPSGADAAAMAAVIRGALSELGFAERGETVPVLYGGSVTSANVGEFLAEPELDGALVGGASLKVDEMAGIVARAALTARARRAMSERAGVRT